MSTVPTINYERRKPGRFRRPRWWSVTIVAVSGLLLAVTYVAACPARAAGGLSYVRDIPLVEAVGYAARTNPGGVIYDRWTRFVAVFLAAALIWLAGLLRSNAGGRVIPFLGALLSPIGLLGIGLLQWLYILAMGPALLGAAILGRCDGETWSEGFVVYAGVATWAWLWLAIGIVELLMRFVRPAWFQADEVAASLTTVE